MDAHLNYWLEAVECSLDELGVLNALTKEQREQLASDMQSSHENYGMAFYSPPPSDIYAERERAMEQKLRQAQKQTEAAILDFKKNVAMRHGCEIQDVTIEEGGHAKVAWSKLA